MNGMETESLEEAKQFIFYLENKHPDREYKKVRKKS